MGKKYNVYEVYGFKISVLVIFLIISICLIAPNLKLIHSYLFAINLATFLVYYHDKNISEKVVTNNRIPAIFLHGIAALGGSIGAIFGIITFRHKTLQIGHQMVLTVILLIQFLVVYSGIIHVF